MEFDTDHFAGCTEALIRLGIEADGHVSRRPLRPTPERLFAPVYQDNLRRIAHQKLRGFSVLSLHHHFRLLAQAIEALQSAMDLSAGFRFVPPLFGFRWR